MTTSTPASLKSLSCDQIGNAELPCESECRPIAWVPGRDPVLRLYAPVLIVGRRLPLDRHHLQRGEQQRGIELPLHGEPRDVPRDSTATASTARHLGPCADASLARPPISADRTTFASATTTAGSEIVEHLLLGDAVRLERRADLLRQLEEHLAANLDR